MTKRVPEGGFIPLATRAPTVESWPVIRSKCLRCVNCGHEFEVRKDAAFDLSITCPKCHEESEVRVFHEEWCQYRRHTLEGAPTGRKKIRELA
jgi:phage FluMu protein Com